MPRSGSATRVNRSSGSGSSAAARGGGRWLAVAFAVAGAVALWLGWSRLGSVGTSVAGPEQQIRKSLQDQDRAVMHLGGSAAGATVDLHPVHFEDVTPIVEGDRATVVALVAAEGRVAWSAGEARISYIGRERFEMKPCSGAAWCGDADQLARLRGVLLALLDRCDAVRRRDAAAYELLLARDYRDHGEDRAQAASRIASDLARSRARWRVRAWQVRVERAGAEVGEDVEVTEPGAEPRQERHVYRLEPDGERWVLSGGV